jgi:hypothetical protein
MVIFILNDSWHWMDDASEGTWGCYIISKVRLGRLGKIYISLTNYILAKHGGALKLSRIKQ